jgi:hypothetical protein
MYIWDLEFFGLDQIFAEIDPHLYLSAYSHIALNFKPRILLVRLVI